MLYRFKVSSHISYGSGSKIDLLYDLTVGSMQSFYHSKAQLYLQKKMSCVFK